MTPAEKEEWRDPAGTRRLATLPAGKQAPEAKRNGPLYKIPSLELNAKKGTQTRGAFCFI
ncbi:hypothetical protein ASG66_17735 [Bacillus sp. Leaf406]|nr:hypothetical protein ASG66_17735 [Bacillus sp. Leaf406]